MRLSGAGARARTYTLVHIPRPLYFLYRVDYIPNVIMHTLGVRKYVTIFREIS